MKIGTSYFGNRAVNHVREDMKDLKELGFTHVFHTFSEEDLAFYKESMKEIVEASHKEGLGVYVGPWGVANIFGGEALSKFVPNHYDCWQVASNGSSYPTICLNSEKLMNYMMEWIDAAKYIGADVVFWDEPHWLMPHFFGLDHAVWGCRCNTCQKLYYDMFKEEMPWHENENVKAFKKHSLNRFVFSLSDYAKAKGLQVAVCLLPMMRDREDELHWEEIIGYPGIDIFATDPYWMLGEVGLDPNYDLGLEHFVSFFSKKVFELCSKYDKEGQIWIQNFVIKEGREEEVAIAFQNAYNAGIRNIFTWSFQGSNYMSLLRSQRPELAWKYFVTAAQAVKEFNTVCNL